MNHAAGFSCSCVALCLLLTAASSPAQFVPHDPRLSYDYGLAGRAGEVAEVELEEAGFAWPALTAVADTAFLEIEIEAGRTNAPAIEARLLEVRTRQYLERRARGRRYVDLSPLARSSPVQGTWVDLAGEGVRWSSGRARLVVFRNPALDGRRVLVVAPHPDDAEIAAFGVYSESQACVVTVTAGDAGGANYDRLFAEPGEHYRIKGWLRTWDSIVVPTLGGVPPERASNLGFFDATLKELYDVRPAAVSPPLAELPEPAFYRRLNVSPGVRSRPFVATWEGLVADLLAEIASCSPSVIVAPHPSLDRHLDHQFTAIALIEAIERSGRSDLELWLYTNHPIEEEAFPFGPPDGLQGLPPWYQPGLVFSRLYSHPLSSERQRLKVLALDAMHDLRPFEPPAWPAPPQPVGEPAGEYARRGERLPADAYSYFRRAPRPNELFWVLTVEDARALRLAFLEGLASSPVGLASSPVEHP